MVNAVPEMGFPTSGNGTITENVSPSSSTGNLPVMALTCRRQYKEIYFHELFLVAHFSQKFEKPSDKVPTVHFLLCDDIVHFATASTVQYLRNNVRTWESIDTDHRPQTTDHRPQTTDHRPQTTHFKSFLLLEGIWIKGWPPILAPHWRTICHFT